VASQVLVSGPHWRVACYIQTTRRMGSTVLLPATAMGEETSSGSLYLHVYHEVLQARGWGTVTRTRTRTILHISRLSYLK